MKLFFTIFICIFCMLSGYAAGINADFDSNTKNIRNGIVSDNTNENTVLDEKTVQSTISRSTKEVNNVLKQIKLDASFSDVKYNKKDKTLEGNILYMESKYYFKMNAATGEVIEMRASD